MKNILTSAFMTALWSVVSLSAQNSFTFERELKWAAAPALHERSSGEMLEFWNFEGCGFLDEAPTLPVWVERFPLSGPALVEASLISADYEGFQKQKHPDNAQLQNTLRLRTRLEQERDRYFGVVEVMPVRRLAGNIERARRFSVAVKTTPLPVAPVSAGDRDDPTRTSALSSGAIYKFGVANSGIYRLDYNFLKNELGLSNIDQIDPRTIRLYGNGGAMLPEKNADPRPDDLLENAVQIIGESDGKFDPSDVLLFYAAGPSPWVYRASTTDPQITLRPNLYDRHAWYFLKVGDGTGLRIKEQASTPANDYTSESFDDVRRIESDKTNLLNFNQSAQGSGKRWFGDYFYQTRERLYTFDVPDVITDSLGRIRVEFAGRSDVPTILRVDASGTLFTRNISDVEVSDNDASFAAWGVASGVFKPSGDKVEIGLSYPEVSEKSEGWLDFIEINLRRKLRMSGTQMEFRDLWSAKWPTTLFRLSGGNNLSVWDVTDPQTPAIQQHNLNGGVREFGANTLGTLRNYIAWETSAEIPKPEKAIGKIANQNLHGIDDVHMAIIYHPVLESQAKQLAEHRQSTGGLDVALVNIEELFNEFSSGGKEPTAIRDFARMLLNRQPQKFEYLLLLGDGSFDPKNNSEGEGNNDYIPVWETAESFSPIYSFPSDDYFGLLSPDEGPALTGRLDIAVGRIPARNAADAQAVVDKLIAYDKDPALLGDWHIRTLFIGDDEDSNAHINQADKLAQINAADEKWFNVEKVYFDATQQVATSGGQRYPDAKSAINSNMFKGVLTMNYIGHGGPRGWAQERVIDNNDIAGWENPNRYPLIITATCTFGGYDDYTTLTGGEQALLKVKSGAIGLFTTVRSVYIDGNNKLTDAVQDIIFQRGPKGYRSIGEILQDAKNNLTSGADNARRFTLLGDPAMFLALPELRVSTTKINGKEYDSTQPDTLKALMPVELEGRIVDTLGNPVNEFNGNIYVSIIDKAQTLQTLGQDPTSIVRNFSVQRNVLFKGSATVTKGGFKIKFIVPKDINYNFGIGKISYYAEDGTPLDAAGADPVVIGGNSGIVKDDNPPTVQAFMNTDAFAVGGITNNDPKILVKCSDDNGMNVSGTSLGHDLTAVLDGNVLETIVLNDFYQSTANDYRSGQAIYPLRNLAVGRHTLAVKGWDIANNSGEGYTEFVVAEDGKAALDHVLNFPNPFSTNTAFQFEHNLAGQILDVQISIFSVSGKLVATLLHQAQNTDGFRVTDIQWNGRDDYGDPLARGVYIYRVKVRGTDAEGKSVSAESDFEKLVILK